MASNQLSDKTKDNIKDTVDCLFGRILNAYPCPLNMDQMRDLSWAQVPDEHMSRLRHLLADYGKKFFWHTSSVVFEIDGQGVSFKEILPEGDTSDQFFAVPLGHINTEIPIPALEHRLGSQVTQELRVWVKNAARITTEFNESWDCLVELVAMATTPGQVRRMLPDLTEYLNHSEKRILLQQQRASSMPYDWAAYDRNKVNRLTENMAKCKLLADNDSKWSLRESCTWPTFSP